MEISKKEKEENWFKKKSYKICKKIKLKKMKDNWLKKG